MDLGDQAPGFTLRDQHGREVSLAGHRGRVVVVMFYPFAFSGTCTGELGAVQEVLPSLQNDDVQILAVSCDPKHALRVFAERDGLGFPLLSDFWPHGEVARAYGAFVEERGCAGRSTFVVDRAGLVRWTVHHPMGEPRDPREPARVAAELASTGPAGG